MKTFKKILYFFTPQEKKHAGLILVMTIIMAFMDMMGVASSLPFIAVISNPSLIETNFFLEYLFQISNALGFKTNNEFKFFLGFLSLFLLIFSLSVKALTIYFQMHFIYMRGHSISKKLFEGYLNQPYSWYLNRNSAELSKTILSEANLITSQGLSPLFNIVTYSLITIFLITLLFLVNIKLTFIIIFAIGGLYLTLFNFLKKFLKRIGEERLVANGLRFKTISEAFGSSKELKLSGLEKVFIKKFSDPSKIFAINQARSSIIGILPRFFIEALAFGGMLIMILFIMSKTGSFIDSIPMVTIYAFAGYRLMPSFQQIYQASAQLKFSKPAINRIYNDFKSLKVSNLVEDKKNVTFNKSIVLNRINFNYPNSSKTSIQDISLSIPAKTKVGFIGPTGCGKTTIVDIISGLLQPQKGTLEIDGLVINDNNRRSWQSFIGYVPQNIYLSDNTIASNIGFGVDNKNINQDVVEKVSKIAELHDFITEELPDQYQTVIGERGVRLSGGQRQRIGIARALYHNPKVLILDEATNALDNQTEKVVMDALNNIDKNITIIIIAHRLNTLEKCDLVFEFDKGKILKNTFNITHKV